MKKFLSLWRCLKLSRTRLKLNWWCREQELVEMKNIYWKKLSYVFFMFFPLSSRQRHDDNDDVQEEVRGNISSMEFRASDDGRQSFTRSTRKAITVWTFNSRHRFLLLNTRQLLNVWLNLWHVSEDFTMIEYENEISVDKILLSRTSLQIERLSPYWKKCVRWARKRENLLIRWIYLFNLFSFFFAFRSIEWNHSRE